MLRGQFPGYEVSLSIELPLRNRAAEARLAQQRLLQRRLEAMRRQARIQMAGGIARGLPGSMPRQSVSSLPARLSNSVKTVLKVSSGCFAKVNPTI